MCLLHRGRKALLAQQEEKGLGQNVPFGHSCIFPPTHVTAFRFVLVPESFLDGHSGSKY